MSPPSSGPVGRLRGRRRFGALRQTGVRRRSGPVTVTALTDQDAEFASVAYAVPRSVGNAVERNRLRRRLRAIVRDADLPAGSYLLSASRAALDLPFEELAAHVRRAGQR